VLTFNLSDNGDPTRLDALAMAAGVIWNNREGTTIPNAVLINPLDWFSDDFRLAKNGFENYHGPGPWASLDMQSPWGFTPIITTAIPEGTQVLGDWSQLLFGDRQSAAIYMTDAHRDHFQRNILDILAELRMTVGVRIPEAFIVISDES
jgi:hypothetical protein